MRLICICICSKNLSYALSSLLIWTICRGRMRWAEPRSSVMVRTWRLLVLNRRKGRLYGWVSVADGHRRWHWWHRQGFHVAGTMCSSPVVPSSLHLGSSVLSISINVPVWWKSWGKAKSPFRESLGTSMISSSISLSLSHISFILLSAKQNKQKRSVQ